MVHVRTQFGLFAEEYARRYLVGRGYKILDSNYSKPWGEVDVVAFKSGVVIFVEVKANKDSFPGFEPELRVNPEKIKKLIRTARTYLLAKKYPSEQNWQIDIMALTLDRARGVAKVKHYKNIEVK